MESHLALNSASTLVGISFYMICILDTEYHMIHIIMIVVEWTVVVSHGLQNVLYYPCLLYCYFAVHHCFCLFVFSFSLVHFQFMMSFKDFLIKILYLVSCIYGINIWGWNFQREVSYC